MKILIAAVALTIAVPAAAQTGQAANPHAAHQGDHGKHGTDHGKHGGSGHEGHKNCCEHKTADGKRMDCCDKAKAAGGKMECCEKNAQQKGGSGAGHQGHD